MRATPFQAIGCAKDLEGFAALYAQVRQSKVEAWADDLVAISEDRDSEPNDRRVRIDTKRWLMCQNWFQRNTATES